MSHDINLYLTEILSCIAKIERYLADIETQEALEKDDKTFDAVAMNLQVIGEAVRYIPDELRAANPQIKWSSIVGLRNIISHAYASLDPEIIWDTVQNKLTELRNCVAKIKEELLQMDI